jgi:cilia- and flagella-associated protein 52
MAGLDAGVDAPDVLEVEHVIGYTGRFRGTVHCHPSSDSTYVFSLGSHVVIADATDPHKQEFLRGHDEEVSAVCLSAAANLIASGQRSSRRAPVSIVVLIARLLLLLPFPLSYMTL